ncbi:MAG: hypothetical protein ACTJG2_00180 [Candidatus Saccharimonadales bacterium]
MNIRQPKRLSRTLISFVAVFALIMQPFWEISFPAAFAVSSNIAKIELEAGASQEVKVDTRSAQVPEQSAVNPEITALKPVLWSGDNYKGISIDTRFVNVTDLQGATITVNRAGGSTVTKTMKQARIDAINAANGAALSLTVPFTIQEMTYSEADSGSWSLPSTKEWTTATAPISVEISFVFADSSKNVNETAQMNNRGIDYISLLPPVDSTPQTTLVTPTGVVGSKFKITGTATDNEALNRVYVQLVNREDHKRYGGTTVGLIGKGVEADWSVEYDTKKQNLPEGRYAAHVAVVDMKGNTSSQGWSENFVVDTTGPVFNSVSPTTGTAINKDFTVTADVTDKEVGVQKIALYVINTETNKKAREYAMTKGADNKWSANVKLADLNGDATYDLRFRAVDSVNNVTHHNNRGGAYLVTVDTTAPEALLTSTDMNPTELTVGIEDAHPQGTYAVNVYTKDRQLKGTICRGDFGVGETSRSCTTDVEVFKSLSDGEYYFKANVVDAVGNNSAHGEDTTAIHPFTIDRTAPTVSVKTGAGDSVGTHPYYSKISFKLYDKNKNLKEVELNGQTYVRGGEWNDLNWQNIQKSHLIEGENTIIVRDKVGNESSLEFEYDVTAPKVLSLTHSNNNDNTLVNTNVTSTLRVSEPIQTPAGWAAVPGSDNTEFTKVSTANNKGTVTITDRARNISSFFFEVKRIDTTEPTFSVQDGQFLQTTSHTVTIFENNISHVEVNGQRVQHAGNKPYTITLNGEDSYTIVAYDKAGNSNTVTVVLDATAPAAMLNMANGEVTNGATNFIVSAADGGAGLRNVAAIITNSEGVAMRPTCVNDAIGGLASYNLECDLSGLADDVYTIYGHAIDRAGNRIGFSEVNITIDRTTGANTESEGSGGGKTFTPVNASPLNAEPLTIMSRGLDSPLTATTSAATLSGVFGLSIATALAQTATTPQTQAITSANEEVLGLNTGVSEGSVLGASTEADEGWSLVNAAAAVLTTFLSLVALAGLRRKTGEEGGRSALRVFTIIPAAVAIVAFFATETLSAQMTWVNLWTWLFAAAVVLQIILLALARRSPEHE